MWDTGDLIQLRAGHKEQQFSTRHLNLTNGHLLQDACPLWGGSYSERFWTLPLQSGWIPGPAQARDSIFNSLVQKLAPRLPPFCFLLDRATESAAAFKKKTNPTLGDYKQEDTN